MSKTPKLGGLGGEQGNTQLPVPTAKTQAPKRKMHFFTVNNHTDEIVGGLLEFFDNNAKKYRIQEEIGQNGTPHLQGCVMFDKEMRSTQWDKASKGHYEAIKGTWEQAVTYCSKTETRSGKEWSKGIPRPIRIISELYPWQKEAEKILTSPDYNDRTVHWWYETTGNVGKSQFSRYMVVKHKALYCGSGKYADIINMVFNTDMDECRAIIFDIPRAQGANVSYAAIEAIKNGIISNTKYETGQKVFNPPNIMVFSNSPAKVEELSADKWSIRCLSEEFE